MKNSFEQALHHFSVLPTLDATAQRMYILRQVSEEALVEMRHILTANMQYGNYAIATEEIFPDVAQIIQLPHAYDEAKCMDEYSIANGRQNA